MRWCGCLLLLVVLGCGDETVATTTSTSGGGGGSAPLVCAATEVPGPDGACHVVGVPPEQCPNGFEARDGGCEPSLPPSPCPSGEMALPGDSACRPLADCGQGPWGAIDTAMVSVFVDANYSGGASDGSMSDPYVSLQTAVDMVEPGGVIAIAAGSYSGSLQILNQPVVLWGVCPELVELVGPSDPAVGAIEIANPPASGTEVRGVSVTGPGFGIALTDASDVVIEQVWIHDTGAQGLSVVDPLGPAVATLRRSLIERATGLGAFCSGSELHIESSEIRNTVSTAASKIGAGASFLISPISETPSTGSVQSSYLHDLEGIGIAVGSSLASIVDTAVHDVAPLMPSLQDGHGILVETGSGDPAADADIRGTSVARTHEAGLLVVDASASVSSSSFVDVSPQAADQTGGVGVAVERLDPTAPAVTATLEHLFVARSPAFGIIVANATVSVDASLVIGTQPVGGAESGDGLTVIRLSDPSMATIRASRFESCERAGVSAFSADVVLDGSMFECNGIHLDGEAIPAGPFDFSDVGGNVCGCRDETEICQAVSANLAAPTPP